MSDTMRKNMLKKLLDHYGSAIKPEEKKKRKGVQSDKNEFKKGQSTFNGVGVLCQEPKNKLCQQMMQPVWGFPNYNQNPCLFYPKTLSGGCHFCQYGKMLKDKSMCGCCGGLMIGGDIFGGLIMGGMPMGGLMMGGMPMGGLMMGGMPMGGLMMGGSEDYMYAPDYEPRRYYPLGGQSEKPKVEKKRKKSDWQKFIQKGYKKTEAKLKRQKKPNGFKEVQKLLSMQWKKYDKNLDKALKNL